MVDDSFNTQLKTDLVVAESVSLPLTLILLVMIFGGLTAASARVPSAERKYGFSTTGTVQ
ncbi:hypothetical protein AIIKEEIJ_02664 [Rhodococcus sp. YH1]|nr:hypothetical protein [Rhodococcus sp. YH1]